MPTAQVAVSPSNLNVTANAVAAVTGEILRNWEVGSLWMRLFTGNLLPAEKKAMGDFARQFIHVQTGGDYVKRSINTSRVDTAGPVDPMDVYTISSPVLFDEARFFWRMYGMRIAANHLEVAQVKGQGKRGIFNLVKTKMEIGFDTLVEIISKDIVGGYGYRRSGMLGSGPTSGRLTLQGLAMMCDGPALNENGAAANGAAGNGDKDGTAVSTAGGTPSNRACGNRSTMTGQDANYGGINRDATEAVDWRGNLFVCPGATTVGVANYNVFSRAITAATHGKGGPRFGVASRNARQIVRKIFLGSSLPFRQLVGDNDMVNMGASGVGVDTLPIFEDELMGSTDFEETAALGGKYYVSQDTTAAATCIELKEYVNEGVYFVNPNPNCLKLNALEDMCDAKGRPKILPAQESELVFGTLASVEWAAALDGNPRDHSVVVGVNG